VAWEDAIELAGLCRLVVAMFPNSNNSAKDGAAAVIRALRAEKVLLEVSTSICRRGRSNSVRSHNAEPISAFFVSMNRASYESATLSKKTL